MNGARGLRRAAFVALLSAELLGCHRGQPSPGQSSPAAASDPGAASGAVSARPPIDRLGPGELPPGTESLYGLVLPRGMKVIAQFPRIGHAVGPLAPEDVANYVRDRVTAGRVELGAVGTTFPNVTIKDGDPDKRFRIEVIPLGDRTKLVVEDVSTPPVRVPVDPTLTPAERWRRAGYNPDGTPLNPNELR